MTSTTFDQSRGDYVQGTIQTVNAIQKLNEIHEIRSDFDRWMNKWFNLKPSQLLIQYRYMG